jgi:phosphopantothenoylcysteine decarboxylase / phosphopantothenate---cysteine ligase
VFIRVHLWLFSFLQPPADMARILITSGPTRQYLDPVRYLSNASSGRMGAALAAAAIEAGHRVTIVSGPVSIEYPAAADVIPVVSTEEMLAACQKTFSACDGLIAVAAPCDFRPANVAAQKIHKTGQPLRLELAETPDIVATLAAERSPHPNPLPKGEGTERRRQWIVAFALETEDRHLRARQKLERKGCDLIVVNGPEALQAGDTRVEILDKGGDVLGSFTGSKSDVARSVFKIIRQRLIESR